MKIEHLKVVLKKEWKVFPLIYIINSPYHKLVIFIVNGRSLRESPCRLRNNNNKHLSMLTVYIVAFWKISSMQ